MTFTSKHLLISLSLLIATAIYCPVFAQNNLMKTIAIGDIKRQSISSLLDVISRKGDFYFAYNNKFVPADSLVSISDFHGTVLSLLTNLLGSDYEFKESSGYVVLRHAPYRLSLAAELVEDKNSGGTLTVKGFVKDAYDQKAVRRASVYEKDLMASTMTDDKGYFELKLKNYSGSLLLTATKEDYRDTTLNMLPVVNVITTIGGKSKLYKYYPDDQSGASIERSRFARFFLSSKQLVQGINLGNYFASAPYQVSFIPGLSSRGMYNSQLVDNFSLNILGGYTGGIAGFEAAGIFNINRKDVGVFQAAGIFNVVGGNVRGVQAAGIYNNVFNTVSGVQIAGIANYSRQFNGAQIAGIANITQHSNGFQIAGIFNGSTGDADSQISGIFNVAKKVKGVQITSIINVADSSDYPVGLINLIKNGEKSIAVSTDQDLFMHVDLRTGGRVTYGIIGAGYKSVNTNDPGYLLTMGLGMHLTHGIFSMNSELVVQNATDFRETSYTTASLKLLPSYMLGKNFRLFAGPSLNGIFNYNGYFIKTNSWVLHRDKLNSPDASIGITGGIQFVW
jgi:hypothetical protein